MVTSAVVSTWSPLNGEVPIPKWKKSACAEKMCVHSPIKGLNSLNIKDEFALPFIGGTLTRE